MADQLLNDLLQRAAGAVPGGTIPPEAIATREAPVGSLLAIGSDGIPAFDPLAMPLAFDVRIRKVEPTLFLEDLGTPREWGVGVDGADGHFFVDDFTDVSAGLNRFRINVDGSASFQGGAVAMGPLTATTGNFSGAVDIAGLTTISASGQALLLNGATSRYINFSASGLGIPTKTTYSPGVKMVLWDSITASITGYAIGMAGNVMWFGVSSGASDRFEWYGDISRYGYLSSSVFELTAGQSVIFPGALTIGNTTTVQAGGLDVNAGGIICSGIVSGGGNAGIKLDRSGATQYITFGADNLAPPSFSTYSTGSKIILWDSLAADDVGFALGYDTDVMWLSVGKTSHSFKFYAGETNIAEITGGVDKTTFWPDGGALSLGDNFVTGHPIQSSIHLNSSQADGVAGDDAFASLMTFKWRRNDPSGSECASDDLIGGLEFFYTKISGAPSKQGSLYFRGPTFASPGGSPGGIIFEFSHSATIQGSLIVENPTHGLGDGSVIATFFGFTSTTGMDNLVGGEISLIASNVTRVQIGTGIDFTLGAAATFLRSTSTVTDSTAVWQNLDSAASVHTILHRYQFSTTAPATVTAAEWRIAQEQVWTSTGSTQDTQASLWLRDGGAGGVVEVLRLLGSDKSVTVFGDFTVSGTPTTVVRNFATVSEFGTTSDHEVWLVRNIDALGNTLGRVATLNDIANRPASSFGYGLIVGNRASVAGFGNQGARCEFHIKSGTAFGGYYYANDTAGVKFGGSKSRSNDVGTVGTIVQDGDDLLFIYANGDDGTDLVTNAAAILFEVDGTPGANDVPGAIRFQTSISGSRDTRWSVVNAGHFLPESAYDLGGSSNYVRDLYIQRLHYVAETETITGGVADGFAAGLRLDPAYTAAAGFAVAIHNYIDFQNPAGLGAGPASITDAAIARFDAAAGVHKALTAQAVKINVDGTLQYQPFYPVGGPLVLPIPLAITERAAAVGAVAGNGLFWVKDDAPNRPYFSDDTDVDYQIGLVAYAGISASDAADTITIAASGQANKVQIDSFDTNGPSENATPDHTNAHITVLYAAKYKVKCFITIISIAGSGSLFGFAAYKNNGATEIPEVHAHQDLPAGASVYQNISMGYTVALAANDTVEVWAWNETNADNFKVDDVTFTIERVAQ